MTDEGSRHGGVSRRRWLAFAGGSLPLALAGCLGGDDDQSEDGPPNTTNATTDDGPADPSPDNTTDDSTDNPPDDTDDSTDDDEEEEDPPATLSEIRIDDTPEATPFGVGADVPISVTLTSEATDSHEFTSRLVVYRVPNGSTDGADSPSEDASPVPDDATHVLTESRDIALDAGASRRFSFAGITNRLDQGTYRIVVRAGGDHATIGTSILSTASVPVLAYTQEPDKEFEATGGELVVTGTNTGTEYARVSLPEEPVPFVDLPLGETTEYTLRLENPRDQYGSYPSGETTVSLADPQPDPVTVVAAYPFNQTNRYRFRMYIYNPAGTGSSAPTESFNYGTYAGPEKYHMYYTVRSAIPERARDPDDSPPEYGADLQAFDGRVPSHSLLLDRSNNGYFYPGTRARWEWSEAEGALEWGRLSQWCVYVGLDGTANEYDTRFEYVRVDSVDGTDVHVYELLEQNMEVFINPETGYVIRVVNMGLGKVENAFEVFEAEAFGEPESLDWELIKNRSTAETGPNLNGRNLEELPWERREQ